MDAYPEVEDAVAGRVLRRTVWQGVVGVVAVASVVLAFTVGGAHPAVFAAISHPRPPTSALPTTVPPTTAPSTTSPEPAMTTEPATVDPGAKTAAGPAGHGAPSTTHRTTAPTGATSSQSTPPPGGTPYSATTCSVDYTWGAGTFNPTGQEATFTEHILDPSVSCAGPPRQVFWATYSWKADGSRVLFASETFMLSADLPVHHTIVVYDQPCNGGINFAFGDVPLPQTIPAGVFYPGPMVDWNVGKGYFRVSAPQVTAACTFPSNPA